MGSCVSVTKEPGLRMSGSKNENLLIPSPVKQKLDDFISDDPTVGEVGIKPQPSTPSCDSGNIEDTFFNSSPWLESDCEGDFFSVTSDFSPSSGTTPFYHKFSSGKMPMDDTASVERTFDSLPELCLPDKNNRLSELFKESSCSNFYVDNDENVLEKTQAATSSVHDKLKNRTPSFSGANCRGSNERGPNGAEDQSLKSAHCCLPRLLPSCSFSERKKKTSPARIIA